MTTRLTAFAYASGLLLAIAPPDGAAEATKEEERPGVLVEEVLEAVQEGLLQAQRTLEPQKNTIPALSSVELDLETIATKKAGGGFSIWVISIGGKYEKESASKLSIKLTPPEAKPGAVATDVAKALADMIVAAADGTYKSGDAPIPLKPAKVTAQLKFVVKKSGEAGGKFIIQPVTVELSGGLASTAVQTITVTFGK